MGSRCKRLRSANFILLQPFDGLCCTVSLYPFQSGTDIRETECHPTHKKGGISAQKQLFVVFGIYRLSDASLLCDAKHFFFQLGNFYETTIIVATGMIKRTDLENCRDKSDVIYGN